MSEWVESRVSASDSGTSHQQASHNKLVEFWPIPPDRAGVTVRFVGLLARTRFFSSAHRFSKGLRSGLCDGHSNMLGVIVHLEDPFATKL